MKKYINEILYLLGDERKKLPFLFILFISSSLLDLAGLGLIGPYIGLVVSSNSLAEGRFHDLVQLIGFPLEKRLLLIWLGLILVSLFLLKAGAAIYINRSIMLFSNAQIVRLKSHLMHSYQHMPYGDYLKRNSAEYIVTIQNYTNSFGGVLANSLKLVSEGSVALAILIMLFWSNGPALLLLVALLGGLVYVYDHFFRKNIHIYGKRANEAITIAVKGVHEGIEGLKEIRILSKEKYFHQMVLSNSEEAAKNQIKSDIISMIPRYLLEFMLMVFIVSLVIGSILIGHDLKNLIPTLGVFGVASLRLMPSANIFSSGLMKMRFSRHSISKLYKDLQELENLELDQKALSNSQESKNTFQNLILSNINYKYPNTKLPALKNISFEFSAGEAIGLIGASGSGKTTLVDMLMGLLEPQEGDLYYNGKNLKDSLYKWRSQIAYLPQQVFLIDDTLRRNVALGMKDKEINDNEVIEALQQARLMEHVDQLPKGMNTLLGERGVRFSGGQRQRVVLARAFYHKRNVLILDEATSALDNETEKEIVEEIKHFKGEKTMIVIAHRLSTVKHCDRIYKLDQGCIIENGTTAKMLNPKKLSMSDS
jgi:ATP-binding cassette, subfamily B, bacterial PglK